MTLCVGFTVEERDSELPPERTCLRVYREWFTVRFEPASGRSRVEGSCPQSILTSKQKKMVLTKQSPYNGEVT